MLSRSVACLPPALGLLALGVPMDEARAQTVLSRDAWTFDLGAGTDNRSKDASKSDGQAFVWGQAEWSDRDGRFYAGPAFETIRSSNGSRLELQVAAGFRPQVAGFDLDLNAAHKWQVDARPGTDADAWEFTADIERAIGPASARLRLQHSPDGTGSTRAWTWVAGRVGWEMSPRLKATAELGRREQNAAPDYTGWNVGLSFAATRALDLDLRWHDTNADVPGEQYAGALVAGVSLAF